jgi:RHS repeat-associated protein
MGNILTQKRHKQDGTQIEDMTYRYQRDANGFLLSNRLYHVNDAIDSTIDATDIDDQGAGFDPLNININGAYNYVYDEEGRLIKDKAEDIQQIVWRVDGKVKEINRSTGSTMARLKFDYDAMGRRIAKHVYNNQTGLLEKSTYYLLDAQGNTMATYDYAQAPNQTMSYQLKERHIYGSTRLGMYAESVTLVENPSSETTNTVVNQGFKYYEMTNHLGNVLTVIHDIKIPLNNGSGPAVSSYRVGIRNSTDYSPFGVELDGRTVSNYGYRFGYQGSEKDNEFKGEGNSYTTEFRQLDPRLGRWLSVDPLAGKYSGMTPYVFSTNNPIIYVDVDGRDIIVAVTSMAKFPKGAGENGHMAIIVGNDDIGWHVFSVENIKNYDTYVKQEEAVFEDMVQVIEGTLTGNTGVVFYHHKEATFEDLQTYLTQNAPGVANNEENKGFGYDRFIKLNNTTAQDDEGFLNYLLGLTSNDYDTYEFVQNNCSSTTLEYVNNYCEGVYEDQTWVDRPNTEFDALEQDKQNWFVVIDLKPVHDAQRELIKNQIKTEKKE